MIFQKGKASQLEYSREIIIYINQLEYVCMLCCIEFLNRIWITLDRHCGGRVAYCRLNKCTKFLAFVLAHIKIG